MKTSYQTSSIPPDEAASPASAPSAAEGTGASRQVPSAAMVPTGDQPASDESAGDAPSAVRPPRSTLQVPDSPPPGDALANPQPEPEIPAGLPDLPPLPRQSRFAVPVVDWVARRVEWFAVLLALLIAGLTSPYVLNFAGRNDAGA